MSETLTSAAFSLPTRETAINPWFIAITVTLATFMELLDTAIANVALPHIAGGLAASADRTAFGRLDHGPLDVAMGVLHQHPDRHRLANPDQPAAVGSAGVHARGGSGAQGRKVENRWMGNLLRGHGLRLPGSRARSWTNRRLVRKQLHRVLFCGGHGSATVCHCMGVAPSRSGGRNPSPRGQEFRAGKHFLFYFRVHSLRIVRPDPADAPEAFWLFRDGCRAGPRSGRVCDRHARARGSQHSSENRREGAGWLWIFRFCVRHMALPNP